VKTPVFDQSRCVKYVQEEHELFAVSLSGKMKKKRMYWGKKSPIKVESGHFFKNNPIKKMKRSA